MIGWMLVWSVLNGGVVESNLVFENRGACVDAGHSYGNLPSYTVSTDGELEQLRGGTPFRCLPVNAGGHALIDPADLEKHEALENALLDALYVEMAHAEVLDSITERITDSWVRPVGFLKGMEVLLRFELKPTGDLKSARVIKSSGSDGFDDSAIKAVKKTAPFIEVRKLDKRVFEKSFESLVVKFSPTI